MVTSEEVTVRTRQQTQYRLGTQRMKTVLALCIIRMDHHSKLYTRRYWDLREDQVGQG